jgi:hypothetical protein
MPSRIEDRHAPIGFVRRERPASVARHREGVRSPRSCLDRCDDPAGLDIDFQHVTCRLDGDEGAGRAGQEHDVVRAAMGAEVNEARPAPALQVEHGQVLTVEVEVSGVVAEIRGDAPPAVIGDAHLVGIADARGQRGHLARREVDDRHPSRPGVGDEHLAGER